MHFISEITKLASLIDRYLRHLFIDRNLSPQSIRAYSYDLRLFAEWCGQHSPINVSQDSIRLYFETIIHTGSLQDSTLKRKYISIKSFYRYLQQQGVVSDQTPITLGKNFKKARRIPKTLSREEVRKLIASPQRDMQTLQSPFRRRICLRNQAIIEILFSKDIRIGECSRDRRAKIGIGESGHCSS